MHKLALTVLSSVIFSQTAFAQDAPKILWGSESLGLVHNVSIEIFDNVSGGCWTNAEAIKQKARLTLEQSGISTYLVPLSAGYPFAAAIHVDAFGQRAADSSCFGSIEVGVTSTASRTLGDTYLVGDLYYFQERATAVGVNLNESFANYVEEKINKLASEILSYRRNEHVEALIAEHGEALSATPETHEEMMERLAP